MREFYHLQEGFFSKKKYFGMGGGYTSEGVACIINEKFGDNG